MVPRLGPLTGQCGRADGRMPWRRAGWLNYTTPAQRRPSAPPLPLPRRLETATRGTDSGNTRTHSLNLSLSLSLSQTLLSLSLSLSASLRLPVKPSVPPFPTHLSCKHHPLHWDGLHFTHGTWEGQHLSSPSPNSFAPTGILKVASSLMPWHAMEQGGKDT